MARSNALGELGEQFVAGWLSGRGWDVRARRWHCRGGELDLVVSRPVADRPGGVTLAFVEVKTRGRASWDADGLLAIAPAKQRKLWLAARCFLAEHPHLADCTCRFDVALVRAQKLVGAPPESVSNADSSRDLVRTPSAIRDGYRLTLLDYLPGAIVLE
ncbi:putative endonuclease [Rubidibacter lacunae KORDI 51-2]|uniref:UPF0102 protein KR51_00007930 n=1 Tax=Rubidibacter lacunae KORDI 51-2 TaxID=582515 RepID=U5DS15_9CHRO|nr:YraN family protein [Rubidibacter lacunae]ERN42480.1 putative endonuclease [Rubidibacter lacunae KORDI 51-2]